MRGLAIAAVAAIGSTAAQAQQPVMCSTRDAVEDVLRQYGEQRVFIGMTADRRIVVEVYLNEITESWTIVTNVIEAETSCIGPVGRGATIIPSDAPPGAPL